MIEKKKQELKQHWHCKRCGKILDTNPKFENKMSYFCDDCLVSLAAGENKQTKDEKNV